MKQHWKPSTLMAPVPPLIITSGTIQGKNNLFTAAWTGIVCSSPPMTYVSIRPERFSYKLIKENMQFAINLTTPAMAKATDLVGVVSGRDQDKWALAGLTPVEAKLIDCPLVAESPVSLECAVREVIPLGGHDMFLAEIISVAVEERFIDSETGKLRLDKEGLLVYGHGEYFSLGDFIGYFGWSVKKGEHPQRRK